ncbi:avidin/streptavidin family protein [uncultured Algimonas sp.]|uniref:avidin/streptavidin family protein n=1 Tax=uncultured Algimonas sp. TaxID=1547920 RepID=UPI00260D22A6|nr:avidin/streptavidin family protein [uncultured Algimonas sp.]
MRRFVLGASLLAVSAPDLAHAHDLNGLWVNEAGSAVELNVSEGGTVSGHYRTELGKPDADAPFTLIGWVQGDVIAFTVSFTGYDSITSWSGQLSEDEDGDFIRTLWHHTRDIVEEDEADHLWRSITAGAATFRRVGADVEITQD